MAQSSSRRSILIGLGALAIAVGVVGAVALWTIGGERRSDAVAGFARAPVGCDTTLDFVETGEYFVFIERAGRLDGIRGDCDVEGAYDVGAVTPDADIAIVDPEGQPIALDRTVTDLEYSDGGFVGVAAFTIDIAETDDHVVRVESPADEVFAVAVGRDPNEGVAALRGGAAAVGILGLLLGAGLILLGARRTGVKVAGPQWASGAAAQPSPFVPGQAPQGPPVYGQTAGPPPFGQPPQYGQQAPPQYGQQAPHYGQAPPQYGQAPQYGQQAPPQYSPPAPSPTPASAPAQPQVPGQPGWGPAAPPSAPPSAPTPLAAPQHLAGSAQPIDWAPQAPQHTSGSADTAPPDDDVLARQRDEREADARRTDERPPPAPPS